MQKMQEDDGYGPYQPLPGAGGVARRGTGMLIAVCVVTVCLLAVAVSTRESEYEAYTGFVEGEEEILASKAFMPDHARQVLLHMSGLQGKTLAQSLDDDAPMTADDVDLRAEAWAKEHPQELSKIMGHFAVGLAIGIMGIVCLLWSEISAVMTVRELDRNAWSGEPKPVELAEREALWAHGFGAIVRPWLSIGGIILMFTGFLVALIPMCAILVDFGLEQVPTETDCITSIVLLALLDVIGFAALLASLCWCCTRPYASLILTSVALGANICLMIKSPVFILFWVILAGFLCFFYFQYLPESREGYVPRQDIFNFYHPSQSRYDNGRPNAPGTATHYV